ncbi:conserved hypothetical protein [Vibrio crassostreae]|nr:conserved hypothetical protein [Vibrio crassostreae]
MSTREDVFVKLPELVIDKVELSLEKLRSNLPFRVFEAMARVGKKHPYYSTMELVRAADSPNIPYIVKAYLNPQLCLVGYQIINVIPERAILDDYGCKSRQRYWGFVKI